MGEYSDRELERLLALDGGAGPAQPIDPARSSSIIAAALHSAGFPPPGGGGHGAGGAQGAGRATFAPKLTVLVGGAGAVAIAIALVAWLISTPERPMPRPPAQAASEQPASPPIEPAEPTAPIIASPNEPTTDAATSDPPPAHTPLRSPAPAKLRATPTPSHRRRLPVHAAPVAAAADPEDLLAEANAARLARDWRGADALYTRVASAGGATLAAQTALVATAQLHLEHLGDADGAARRFRRALAAGAQGTLAEEARWGLADVARATGDSAAERRALADFLAHHASSVRATQARTRRAELEATP
jgi:hypothetical protein